MTSEPPVEIALAVVRHAGRVLVGQRPEGVPLAGYWEFPGGKVHADETPEDAAARECREETGMEIRIGVMISVVDHEYPHGRVRLRFFAAEPMDPAQPPAEPFRWIQVVDLPAYRFPPTNAVVIRRLVGHEPKGVD